MCSDLKQSFSWTSNHLRQCTIRPLWCASTFCISELNITYMCNYAGRNFVYSDSIKLLKIIEQLLQHVKPQICQGTMLYFSTCVHPMTRNSRQYNFVFITRVSQPSRCIYNVSHYCCNNSFYQLSYDFSARYLLRVSQDKPIRVCYEVNYFPCNFLGYCIIC